MPHTGQSPVSCTGGSDFGADAATSGLEAVAAAVTVLLAVVAVAAAGVKPPNPKLGTAAAEVLLVVAPNSDEVVAGDEDELVLPNPKLRAGAAADADTTAGLEIASLGAAPNEGIEEETEEEDDDDEEASAPNAKAPKEEVDVNEGANGLATVDEALLPPPNENGLAADASVSSSSFSFSFPPSAAAAANSSLHSV